MANIKYGKGQVCAKLTLPMTISARFASSSALETIKLKIDYVFGKLEIEFLLNPMWQLFFSKLETIYFVGNIFFQSVNTFMSA